MSLYRLFNATGCSSSISNCPRTSIYIYTAAVFLFFAQIGAADSLPRPQTQFPAAKRIDDEGSKPRFSLSLSLSLDEYIYTVVICIRYILVTSNYKRAAAATPANFYLPLSLSLQLTCFHSICLVESEFRADESEPYLYCVWLV